MSGGWSAVPVEDAQGVIDLLVGQINRKKDFMVAVHGGEGSGKSTTAKNLARGVQARLGRPPILIFTFHELLDVLLDCRPGQIFILDEAINIFHNQDWSTWQAKALTKIVRQMRIMRSIWILNVPDWEGLHPYLRDYRIPLRLYHPPVWEPDGLGNGPAKILWRQERLDYKTGQVEYRWQDAGDWHSWNLDDDPEHQEYEQAKIENFKRLVQGVKDRQAKEDAKTTPKPKAQRRKATNRPRPPTTT